VFGEKIFDPDGTSAGGQLVEGSVAFVQGNDLLLVGKMGQQFSESPDAALSAAAVKGAARRPSLVSHPGYTISSRSAQVEQRNLWPGLWVRRPQAMQRSSDISTGSEVVKFVIQFIEPWLKGLGGPECG